MVTPQFDNLFNFRDLGGVAAGPDFVVATGKVFRSDGLHRADSRERQTLADLGIATVVDLRSRAEVERWGRFDTDTTESAWIHASLLEELWTLDMLQAGMSADDFLAARYMEMASTAGDNISAILRTIASPESHAVAFHCSAGKDRTGLIAALVYSAIGVDDATIAADYSATAANMDALLGWIRARTADRGDLADGMVNQPAQFLACPPGAILGFLGELRRRHGSVDGYLDDIGINADDRQNLRAQLLQRPDKDN